MALHIGLKSPYQPRCPSTGAHGIPEPPCGAHCYATTSLLFLLSPSFLHVPASSPSSCCQCLRMAPRGAANRSTGPHPARGDMASGCHQPPWTIWAFTSAVGQSGDNGWAPGQLGAAALACKAATLTSRRRSTVAWAGAQPAEYR